MSTPQLEHSDLATATLPTLERAEITKVIQNHESICRSPKVAAEEFTSKRSIASSRTFVSLDFARDLLSSLRWLLPVFTGVRSNSLPFAKEINALETVALTYASSRGEGKQKEGVAGWWSPLPTSTSFASKSAPCRRKVTADCAIVDTL